MTACRRFGLVEEAGGQGEGGLGEFLGIFAADGRDAVADGDEKAERDLVEKQLTNLRGHRFFRVVRGKRRRPAGVLPLRGIVG